MLQFAYASQRETELVEYFNFTLTNPTEDLNNFSSEMKLSQQLSTSQSNIPLLYSRETTSREKSAQALTKSILEYK